VNGVDQMLKPVDQVRSIVLLRQQRRGASAIDKAPELQIVFTAPQQGRAYLGARQRRQPLRGSEELTPPRGMRGHATSLERRHGFGRDQQPARRLSDPPRRISRERDVTLDGVRIPERGGGVRRGQMRLGAPPVVRRDRATLEGVVPARAAADKVAGAR
jgi:hypothetical protein